MSDISCPYCEEDQDVDHGDGHGYEEGIDHSQNCVNCNKDFIFTTCISYDYLVYCEGDHQLENDVAIDNKMWSCKKCEYSEFRRST